MEIMRSLRQFRQYCWMQPANHLYVLKAGLQSIANVTKKRRGISPDEDAKYWCESGLDKDGFQVKYLSDFKGFGVLTTTEFKKGAFLLEYVGEKISEEEAEMRERKNPENKMFYYKSSIDGKNYCVDAAATLGHICQFVNDAKEDEANGVMRLRVFNGRERLCLFALRDIIPGQEVTYSYGDDRDLWWRKMQNVNDPYDFESDSDPFDLKKYLNEADSDTNLDSDSFDVDSYVSDSESLHADQTSTAIIQVNSPVQSTVNIVYPRQTHPVGSICGSPLDMLEKDQDMDNMYIGITEEPAGETSTAIIRDPPVDSLVKSPVQSAVKLVNPRQVHTVGSIPGSPFDMLEKDQGMDNMDVGITEEPAGETSTAIIHDPPVNSLVNSPVQSAVNMVNSRQVHPDGSIPGSQLDMLEKDQGMDVGITEEPAVPVQSTSTVRANPIKSKHCGAKKAKYKPKPDRYCPYCKAIISGGKLKRHIKRKHKSVTEVQEIMLKPNAIQNTFFDEMRRQGIYEYNLHMMSQDKDDMLMRERHANQEDSLRVCVDCKGFFGNKYFFKHKCVAKEAKRQPLKPMLLQSVSNKMDSDEEFVDVLNRFRDSEVGHLCRTNTCIKIIGYRHFNLRRYEEGKQDEVRKVVMSDMRELGRLFLEFKNKTNENVTVEEMFSREYLTQLIEAIQELVSAGVKDKKEKHGQKLLLDAIILRSVKTLQGHYAENKEDAKRKELKLFRDAYKHKSCEIYPIARQTCVKNSLEKSRKPTNLPSETELRKLKAYTLSEIEHLLANFDIKHYVRLRNLLVCRLTLYNARRGEEASRMLRKEWEDAEKGVWLPEEEIEKVVDPAEKYLFGKYKLGYMKGKGKKYVPVLVPVDLLPAITLLIEHRCSFGIRKENIFLFATKYRLSHCSGWHAVSDVSKEAGIHIPITATKMRHRLSTVYASLDMSPQDRRIFLQHMGHEDSVNRQNYQCPQGVQTVCVMGKMLSSMDEGETSTAIIHDPPVKSLVNSPVQSAVKLVTPCQTHPVGSFPGSQLDMLENDQDMNNMDVGTTEEPAGETSTAIIHDPPVNSLVNSPMQSAANMVHPVGSIPGSPLDMLETDQGMDNMDVGITEEPTGDEAGLSVGYKKRRQSVAWSKEDTKTVICYFERWIHQDFQHTGNKGAMPCKSQILHFLEGGHMLESIQQYSLHQQYKLTYTKVFNERKRLREKARQKMKTLKLCSKV